MAMIYYDTEIESIDERKYATIRKKSGELVLRIPIKPCPSTENPLILINSTPYVGGKCANPEKCSCKFRPWCTKLWDPSAEVECDEDTWLNEEGWAQWCSDELDNNGYEPDLTEKEAETLYKILAGKVRKKWKYDEKKK